MVSQFVSLGYTIIGKTSDLTVVQKTIIDTLQKMGRPQTCIAKEAGCSQSAVSKQKIEWKEKLWGKKDAQPTERTAALRCLSSKIDSRIWEKKKWTFAQWSKVLFSDETKVLESGGRVEKLIAQVARIEQFLFKHDCAPMHKARSIKTWLDGFGVEELDWPTQNPDLNPIQHLWDELERRLQARPSRPTSGPDLTHAFIG
ncbi:Transposable element Tc1 transposase [Labeo rohita]|uniref:Transposable element Tc1 transposase n=1 Tax=Labeo rohita TaxID=84645 RepID=A0ABQ8LDN9_LABRO|nr:Transposable element Tc1 transposase [Labeo rohita]